MRVDVVIVVVVVLCVRQANTLTDVALGKPASMNSYRNESPPSNALDGSNETFIHTSGPGHVTWFEVDLLNIYAIHSVTVTSRDCCEYRFANFTIELTSDQVSYASCLYHPDAFNKFETKELFCDVPTVARYVRITMVAPDARHLDIAEVQVKAEPVCGTWFGFRMSGHIRRTDEAIQHVEVHSPLRCSSSCLEQIMCDAFQIMTSSAGVTCQFFTGLTGNNVSDDAYKYYHFSG